MRLIFDPTVLRPDCPADMQLCVWHPVMQGLDWEDVPGAVAERVYDVQFVSVTPGARSLYGSAIRVYHTHLDLRNPPIPESLRAPTSTAITLDFVASCAGIYSGSAVRNFVYGVKKWHVVHCLSWRVDEAQLSNTMVAAERLAPATSRRPQRQPVTVDWLEAVIAAADPTSPFDAAVVACLTTTFWSVSRLGEFVVPSAAKFDPAVHIKHCDVTEDVQDGRLGLQVTTFRIPWTKVSRSEGETVQWSCQAGVADPQAALCRHFTVNNPTPQEHLFLYKGANGRRSPLSRTKSMRCINELAVAVSREPVKGHSLRIGGVLVYLLLCGISFEVVKIMGRWSSDAFQVYLREHRYILAPYLQASLSLSRSQGLPCQAVPVSHAVGESSLLEFGGVLLRTTRREATPMLVGLCAHWTPTQIRSGFRVEAN
ncbi:hypothetical protein FA13DRAFT_1641001 [Coprinellus micaceus]|uniref:Tyr recombinase domain-containing protein n=1 Tax=Coprinellus micaceus TaxID=71717 RepID=A0A4Y7SLI8_COPMI|nr:hypothetical protein FA13DRAFT_1641001 [Coprinellus micaceus]